MTQNMRKETNGAGEDNTDSLQVEKVIDFSITPYTSAKEGRL